MATELKFYHRIPHKTTDLRHQVDTQSMIDWLRSENERLFAIAQENQKVLGTVTDQCKFELAKNELFECNAVIQAYTDLIYKLEWGPKTAD